MERQREERMAVLDALRGNLIVSCQALQDEPLYSSHIMGRMALAAQQGGAKGIRANTKEDIQEIRKQVSLPIIGIVKQDYPESPVYITPTMKEVEELMEVEPEVIALDATRSRRPHGKTLDEFYRDIRRAYPHQPLMADCSTLEEAVKADELGFDFIGTTLVGYTEQSRGVEIDQEDYALLRAVIKNVHCPVMAEGHFNTPEKAGRAMELGCFSVVVGSAITRPQYITKTFVEALKKG